MQQNIIDFKAKSFLSERNTSTIAYEVKAVRALWDPSLSIPGTNRRGGWRCPTGTRYGGQITDRFGRSCGWGVARRIANQISDIGQRLENVDDARRGRRIARRERRILARLNPQDARAGRLERGLRGVAERLEGGETPRQVRPPARPARRQPPLGGMLDENGRVIPPTANNFDEVVQEAVNRTPRAPRRRRAPARRRQTARPQGDGNLRESEQRRMEREIEKPGAPRTGEAPAQRPQRGAPTRQRPRNLLEAESDDVLQEMLNEMRQDPDYKDSDDYKQVMKEIRRRQRLNNRRRRAVVGEANKPKAPVKKPKAVVEPKVVKPRRPKPIVDVREPDPALERMIDEEDAVARRIEADENVDIGDAPRDFALAGNGRWTRGAWIVTVDREDERVLGLTASDGRGGLVLARNFDELVERMNDADRRQPGNSDNAANSERMRQARADRARGAGRKVNLNQILNERFESYIRGDVIPNDRIMIVNDPANFPETASARKNKRDEALQKINTANRAIDEIDRAINRGELADNDFIEREGVKINVAKVKTYLRNYKDAWGEIYEGNQDKKPAPSPQRPQPQPAVRRIPPAVPAPPAVDPIDAPFIAPDKKDIRNAPEALKHQPPKIEPAKFKAEHEQLIEQALLEIRDVASLNKFSLLVDQAIFNENEGRQGALRNFQKELAKAAEILKRTPDANIDALIAERKREYLANFQMRGGVANARTKLTELETQLRDKFIKLRTPPGNGAEDKERNRVALMEDIATLKKSIGLYEGHLLLVDALEPEIRKASDRIKQGYVFDPDATNIPKPTPADVKKKIKDQISAAVNRRQGKLAKYLKERHPDGGAPFEDMTQDKWGALSQNEKNAYIKQAYSHDMIKGKNGKLYNAVASVSGGSVEVTFNEINAQGQIIRARIGTSSRTVYFGNGKVKQNSMFITSKLDRGADIQTIYNQHAFLYLSKIGVTKAEVNAADDGQYVWARVGFKRGSGLGRGDLRALEAPLKFYEDFGSGGLISNDAEYARIKSILTQASGGAKFSHQDIIFALDDPTGDKPRMEYVKQWFKPNLGFPGGTLKFSEQKVGGTPARRPRRARAPRQRSVPSEI